MDARPLVLLRTGLILSAVVLAALLAPARAASPPPRPPVVMVVFDELSMVDLLDASGHVDPVAAPAFARLARDGTAFRNYTAPGDETGPVTGALLSGEPLRRGVKPYARFFPHTLFTLLAPHYQVVGDEDGTSYCPHRLCPSGDDALTRQRVLDFLKSGRRPARFRDWVRSIRPTSRPAFFYKHTLLPHLPLEYFEDGRDYRPLVAQPPPQFSDEGSMDDPWLVRQSWQRHTLQLRFTDRLLGEMLDRLQAQGLYDRALVVVTADNGEAWGHVGHDRHVADDVTGPEIASTPLFVKRPFEHAGRLEDRHVRAFDVVPTVAGALALRVPWATVGHDAFRDGGAIPSEVVLARRRGAPLRWSLADFQRRREAAVLERERAFGTDGRGPGPWAVGPDRDLVGRPAPVRGRAARLRGAVWDARRYRRVRLRAGSVPRFVTGALTGSAARRGLPLAVAVNGRVAATGTSSRPGRARRRPVLFSFLLPPGALREGGNRVRVHVVAHRRGGRVLLPVAGT